MGTSKEASNHHKTNLCSDERRLIGAQVYAHDQFKPENKVKKVPTRASEETITSKVHQTVKKYPNVDAIKWSKD